MTRQTTELHSKEWQASQKRDITDKLFQLWESTAGNGGCHTRKKEEIRYNFNKFIKAYHGIACQFDLADNPSHKGSSHSLASFFPRPLLSAHKKNSELQSGADAWKQAKIHIFRGDRENSLPYSSPLGPRILYQYKVEVCYHWERWRKLFPTPDPPRMQGRAWLSLGGGKECRERPTLKNQAHVPPP